MKNRADKYFIFYGLSTLFWLKPKYIVFAHKTMKKLTFSNCGNISVPYPFVCGMKSLTGTVFGFVVSILCFCSKRFLYHHLPPPPLGIASPVDEATFEGESKGGKSVFVMQKLFETVNLIEF